MVYRGFVFVLKEKNFSGAMDRSPRKRPSSAEADKNAAIGGKGKKIIKLSNTVKSIIDRTKDQWNLTNAHERVTTELRLLRTLTMMLLSLFKGDLWKLKDDPFECGSNCQLKAVSSFALMIRDRFVDDDFLTGNIFFIFICVEKKRCITVFLI